MNFSRILRIIIFILAAAALAASSARACGGTVHIFISELAIDYVKDPALKKLIEENRNTLLWGSWFPDSGYPAGNQYGEFAHWTPFLNAYADYIRTEITPANPDYGRLVAHYLGASSHSMADQLFDHIFLAKTSEMEGTGQAELDSGLDLICMKKNGRYKLRIADEVYLDLDKYTPIDHLANVFVRLDTNYRDIKSQMLNGQNALALAIKGEMMVSALQYRMLRRDYPWSTKNYYNWPGGITFDAKIVAAYWESLWKRMNGGRDDFIIATLPERNGTLASIDHTSVDSNIYVVFGPKYKTKTVTADSFRVEDAAGRRVSGRFDWAYGSSLLRFIPSEDFAPNTRYFVTLTTAIKNEFDESLPQDFTFRIKTPDAPEKKAKAKND